MFYCVQFIIGGTVMLLASWLSRSSFHFLSAIITLLPILTLLNLRLQIKNMTDETFHLVQQNAIFGAVGMVLFTVLNECQLFFLNLLAYASRFFMYHKGEEYSYPSPLLKIA